MGRSGHFFLFLYFQHPMSVSSFFLFPFVCKDLKSFSTCIGHTLLIVNNRIPNGHMTSMQRRIDFDAM